MKAAASQTPAMRSDVADKQCVCATDAAEKYLDKDNYKMLAGVATIYNSPDPDDIKIHKLIDAAVRSGMTPSKATMAAIDMMFLAHKVSTLCRIPAANASAQGA